MQCYSGVPTLLDYQTSFGTFFHSHFNIQHLSSITTCIKMECLTIKMPPNNTKVFHKLMSKFGSSNKL